MRYPVQDLLDLTGLSIGQVSRRLGISGAERARLLEIGFTDYMAEKAATSYGWHPFEVWPQLAEDRIEASMLECADERCGNRFVPSRKGQRFCTVKCGRRSWDREAKRRRYAEDAEFAEAERERARAYRAQAARAIRIRQLQYRTRKAEALRARKRAWYWTNREEILAKQREYDRNRRPPRQRAA